jgi:2-oxoglutarate ferredoxin oxidoreductase subunit alpha
MENRNNRMILKLAGAAGQGIKTAGLILTKALKRSGYKVFGYTEYPSLIRGGHNVFQIEVFNGVGVTLSVETDILLALDKASINIHKGELSQGGIILYDENTITPDPTIIEELHKNQVDLVPIKLSDLASASGGNSLMKNTVAMGALWELLGLELTELEPLIAETYNKTQEMIDLNIKCLRAGFEDIKAKGLVFKSNINTEEAVKDMMLISGNEAVALGALAAGVRLYSSYPMTPASAILSYLAEHGPKHGMVVKQAEDEITAANMVIGAFHAGTRSMCATSGGGFDLMTETLSLAGMTETPFFCVIGQRPGPATGVPTWTAQGDLDLAIKSGHGEFPRIVLAPGNPEQAFQYTTQALNLAEKFQTPVLMLLDKHLGESFYLAPQFKSEDVTIDRGKIITQATNNEEMKRYAFSEDGVSPRWFPGDQITTFLANSDEHTPKGYSTEDGNDIKAMMQKRLAKTSTILNSLPDPLIYGDVNNADLKIVTWGSNVEVIKAAISEVEKTGKTIALMQIVFCWPLRKEPIMNFLKGEIKTAIIELNATMQLANLIRQETGYEFNNKFNKFDGRPFYIEETINFLSNLVK